MPAFALHPPPPGVCIIHELRSSSHQQVIQAGRELLLEYGNYLVSQSKIAGFCYGALEREAADLPESYLTQGGGVLLAEFSNPQHNEVRWAGSIAWRTLPDAELADSWEIKRLWTRTEARGKGVGRALVQAVIERARRAGKPHLLLDTVPAVMTSAVRLYESMGFLTTSCYSGHSTTGIEYMQKLCDLEK